MLVTCRKVSDLIMYLFRPRWREKLAVIQAGLCHEICKAHILDQKACNRILLPPRGQRTFHDVRTSTLIQLQILAPETGVSPEELGDTCGRRRKFFKCDLHPRMYLYNLDLFNRNSGSNNALQCPATTQEVTNKYLCKICHGDACTGIGSGS